MKLRGEIGNLMPKAEATEQKTPKKKRGGGLLSMLRSVAEALCSRGITVTISFRGDRLLTLGSDAHPTLLPLITRTRGVAINRFFKLIRLIL